MTEFKVGDVVRVSVDVKAEIVYVNSDGSFELRERAVSTRVGMTFDFIPAHALTRTFAVGDEVNTDAELDTLPLGTILVDSEGDAWQSDDDWVGDQAVTVWRVAGSDLHTPTDFAPLRVLHIPTEGDDK